MRVAICSDIHGNIDALNAVLEAARQEGVEHFWCLGDIVGYGGAPDDCVQAVRGTCEHTVLGNDDAAVAGLTDYSYYFEAARSAVEIHAKLVAPEQIRWMRALPTSVALPELGVLLAHATPTAPEAYEYLFLPEQVRRLPGLEALSEVTFIGHLHQFKWFAICAGKVEERSVHDAALESGTKHIVCVGSVGQPRDYDNRASYVVFDTASRLVEFRRVPYDLHQAAHRVLNAGIDRTFAHRLFIGV